MNKKKRIELRVTTLEKKIIEKKAENSGLNTSEYCRNAALGKKINTKLTIEELEVYKDLTKYHNNFTAISNLLKKKDSKFYKEVQEVTKLIKQHLTKFKW